jgi:UDP-3-O-[3-hydroxymyristoyl] glucosamine N-acyltransferase
MGKKSYNLAELAQLTNTRLIGDANHVITNIADLESATGHEASFLSNPKYTPTRYETAMRHSKAGVIFIAPSVQPIEGKNFLVAEDPTRSFQEAIELFRGKSNQLTGFTGIHATAVIHETCKLAEGVSVGPHAVIDAGTTIGAKSFIGAGTYIGPNCTIGTECTIHPHVTLREHTQIGNRVIIQPGAVIGGCGFGYSTDKNGKHTKLNHMGNVVIEDDVEIGSNATIDRARFTSTVIGRGSKIDNLVIVAHNVRIGQDNMIAGHTGIAGSTKTGRCVVIAGQCGVNGHIEIGSGVIVAGRSGVVKSLDKPGMYGGLPAIPLHEHNRNQVLQRNLGAMAETIKELKAKIEKFSL